MAKPICVIYLPADFVISGKEKSAPLELMSALNGYDEKDGNKPNNYWKQYYWFCFYKEGIHEPEFKVYFEKDFTELKFAQLKKIVTDSIKKLI
jgi:hypothetical protein